MRGRKLKIGRTEVALEIDRLHAQEPDGWRKNRMLAVKLTVKGDYTVGDIAELCGVSRSQVQSWLKLVREKGLDALLQRAKPGPRQGQCRGLPTAVQAEFEQKLAAGEFVTAVQAQRWLAKTHHVDRPYNTVWNWLKKWGGVLLVPRPSHSKKDPAAAETFQTELVQRLTALQLPAGSRVKIWMMDEARFGLHTQLRRLWARKGQRPVVSKQIKYQWDYLYGSLDIVSGKAHFCHLPSVNQPSDRTYLEDLVQTDPEAIHVVIRDQAGFHLRDGHPDLPERVRLLSLPPYSPELNPCEQLWDLVKDDIGNRTFESIEALRQAIVPTLERYWNDPSLVLSLIGRAWLQVQANSSPKIIMSF